MTNPEPADAMATIRQLKAERERLALAICGGEDLPGYANAASVEALEKIADQNRKWSMEMIDRMLKLEAERDALAAEVAALRAEKGEVWQQIETAPRDGLIDIWLSDGVRWCDCYYDRICDEWRTSRPSGRLLSIKAQYVTHWMPLPPPPVPA